MKKLSTTIILSLISVIIMAQTSDDFCNSYYIIHAGFSCLHTHSNIETVTGMKDMDTDVFAPGGTVGFTYGKNISYRESVNALFAEVGAELFYNSGTQSVGTKDKSPEAHINTLSATLPVGFSFRVPVNNDCFVIFCGVSPKVNLLANISYQEEERHYYTSGAYSVRKYEYDFNMFSEDDMGEGATANRFQFGLHAGLGLDFGNFELRYKFNADLTPFRSYEFHDNDIKLTTMSHTVSIAYILGNW